VVAVVLDVAVLVGFVLGGASAHERELADYARIAWPFALALLAISLTLPVRRDPLSLWPAGGLVFLAVTVGGLALRWLTGGGTAMPFPLIAAGLLLAGFIGWRLVAAVVGLVLRRR
jgi:hypothetical protein